MSQEKKKYTWHCKVTFNIIPLFIEKKYYVCINVYVCVWPCVKVCDSTYWSVDIDYFALVDIEEKGKEISQWQ